MMVDMTMDADAMADHEVMAMVRQSARDVFGGNCTFIDDDLARLRQMALRGICASNVVTRKTPPSLWDRFLRWLGIRR